MSPRPSAPAPGGVIIPLITLFDNSPHKIHCEGMKKVVRAVLGGQPRAIFLLSSTGEGRWFEKNPALKEEYLMRVLEILGDRVPVVVGLNGNSFDEYWSNYRILEQFDNISALVISPPYERHLDPAPLQKLITRLIRELSFPLYLYNNPAVFAKNQIDVSWINQWDRDENLLGIKDSSPEFVNTPNLHVWCERGKSIYTGKEGDLGKLLLRTPQALRTRVGVVPSIGNISNIPGKIISAALEGDDERVKKLDEELNRTRNLFYDLKKPEGKAQRGLKYTYQAVFGPDSVGRQPVVIPKYEHELGEEFKKDVEKGITRWQELGHLLY